MTAPALIIDFRARRRVSPLGLFILAVGASLLLAAIFLQRDMDDEITRLEYDIAKAKSRLSSPALNSADLDGIDAEYANEVFERLNLSWHDLFASVERVGGDDATLLGLRPEPAKRRVVINGEARDLASVLQYADALETTDFLHSVRLQQHDVDLRNPDRPVRFTLYAEWGK